MILAGTEIEREIQAGNISVDPYNPQHLNPASIDLTLGSGVTIYEDTIHYDNPAHVGGMGIRPCTTKVIDVKEPLKVRKFEMTDKGWIVFPGVAYLMHTVEKVHTNRYVPVLDGKSSVGRLFIWVHVTAGYGDVGFDGQYTLEVTSLFPVRIYFGMRIAQMRFHTIQGAPKNYQDLGHYKGQNSMGAVASVIHKQFQHQGTFVQGLPNPTPQIYDPIYDKTNEPATNCSVGIERIGNSSSTD